MQQVVLIASSTEGNIGVWDLDNGTQLASYKGNGCGRNSFCCLGRDYLVAAQLQKDSLHFWAWHRDQVHQRSFAMERLTAIAASPDGMHLAAGGASGTLYMWEVASGRLLRSWPAHYKAVTKLVYLESGALLVSGGEDTLAAVWLLSEVLDISGDWSPHARVAPLHVWSDHTLPITDIHAGHGDAHAIVVTASQDRTCKIWSLSSGALLRSLSFPCAVTCVALDHGEHALYAAASSGHIYEVDLTGASSSSSSSSSSAPQHHSDGHLRIEGHRQSISSLAVSCDGEKLVSGSDDGSVKVWDMRSRQLLRTFHSYNKAPVAAALVAQWPEQLAGGAAAAGSRVGPKRPLPLAQLAKFTGQPGSLKAWEGPAVVLDGTLPRMGISSSSGLCAAAPQQQQQQQQQVVASSSEQQQGVAQAAADSSGGADVSELHAELAALRSQLAGAQAAAQGWQQLHAQLQQYCVEHVVRGS